MMFSNIAISADSANHEDLSSAIFSGRISLLCAGSTTVDFRRRVEAGSSSVAKYRTSEVKSQVTFLYVPFKGPGM
jgi:hypothetical protein